MELLTELLAHLTTLFGADCESDAHAAIYWYAAHYHGGQASDLYAVLSVSPYRPGPITTLESEGDMVGMMYEELEASYPLNGGSMPPLKRE